MAKKTSELKPNIFCPSCKSRIDFKGDIDFNKFSGHRLCDKCHKLLYVKIVKTKLQECKIINKGFLKFTSEDYELATRQAEQEEKAFLSKTSKSDSGKAQT
jgi:hypothetical protein